MESANSITPPIGDREALQQVLDLLDSTYTNWEPGPDHAPDYLQRAVAILEHQLTGSCDDETLLAR